MKNPKMTKIQPEEVRGYATVFPRVKALTKKMGWRTLDPAGYLLALDRLESEGNYTTHVENILLTLSDISPSLFPAAQSVRNVFAQAESAGTIRKTTPLGTQQHYTLTAYGREVVKEIRAAVAAFAEWERTLPGGRYVPSSSRITKNKQLETLTSENDRLSAVYNQQVKVIREQDVRIHELEMLVASLTRP